MSEEGRQRVHEVSFSTVSCTGEFTTNMTDSQPANKELQGDEESVSNQKSPENGHQNSIKSPITESQITLTATSDNDDVKGSGSALMYKVDDVPPWYFCIFLGLQHYLTMFGSTVSIPYLLSPALCIGPEDPARAAIISTIIFVSGIITLLQSTIGVRLPIVQGGTFAFLLPTFAILNLPEYKCPEMIETPNGTMVGSQFLSTEEKDDLWHTRIRVVQGSIIVASIAQMIIAGTGLVGWLLRFITPLTIAPVITLVGLALFENASHLASGHWGISMLTVVLLLLFSQYLREVSIPFCKYSRGTGIGLIKLPIFKLFPVLLSIVVSWVLCIILTQNDVFPADSPARTDRNTKIVSGSPWFRFPYPGQWGVPEVSFAGAIGMFAGVLSSTVESIGDYYACARLAGAPPPPVHAINRGIFIEGTGCVLAGIWGTGNGTTSYGENIGAIGVTKVGSRRVIQIAAIIMMFFGVMSKFGAVFVTIPEPIVGGVFFVMFGMITAVGLSNLQFVDLNSPRNLMIIGFSLFFGISLPKWLDGNKDAIATGSELLDQILTVLLTTSMFVGGILGLVLDNTIPGTDVERGLIKWQEQHTNHSKQGNNVSNTYDIPLIMEFLKRSKIARYIPVSPTFEPEVMSCNRCRQRKGSCTIDHHEQTVVNINTPQTPGQISNSGGVDNPAFQNSIL